MTSNNNIELAAEIVSAYVSNNSVPAADLPALINEVYAALLRVDVGAAAPAAPLEPPKPAVAVKKSVTNDHIICLEDGKKFKSLKRHLRTQYGLSPEEYREKWGLPADYPYGCAELRQGALQSRQANGSWPAAPPPRRQATRRFFSRCAPRVAGAKNELCPKAEGLSTRLVSFRPCSVKDCVFSLNRSHALLQFCHSAERKSERRRAIREP